MMVGKKKCVICQRTSEKCLLFSFPKESELLDKWLLFCELNSSDLNTTSKVCWRHFEPKAFIKITSQLAIKKSAVPTLKGDNERDYQKWLMKAKTDRKLYKCLICGITSVPTLRFPSNAEVRQKWADFCGIHLDENLALHKYALCRIHFTDQCFGLPATNRVAVLRLAVPTLYPISAVNINKGQDFQNKNETISISDDNNSINIRKEYDSLISEEYLYLNDVDNCQVERSNENIVTLDEENEGGIEPVMKNNSNDNDKFKFLKDYCQNEIEIGHSDLVEFGESYLNKNVNSFDEHCHDDDKYCKRKTSNYLEHIDSCFAVEDYSNNSCVTLYQNQLSQSEKLAANTRPLQIIPTATFDLYPISEANYSKFCQLSELDQSRSQRLLGFHECSTGKCAIKMSKNGAEVECLGQSMDSQKTIASNLGKTPDTVPTQGSSSKEIFPPRFSNRKFPRYFGDIKLCDLGSPKRAQLCLDIGKKTITKYRTTIKRMKTKERSVRKQILSLEQLIKDMQSRNEISDSTTYRLLIKVSQIDRFEST